MHRKRPMVCDGPAVAGQGVAAGTVHQSLRLPRHPGQFPHHPKHPRSDEEPTARYPRQVHLQPGRPRSADTARHHRGDHQTGADGPRDDGNDRPGHRQHTHTGRGGDPLVGVHHQPLQAGAPRGRGGGLRPHTDAAGVLPELRRIAECAHRARQLQHAWCWAPWAAGTTPTPTTGTCCGGGSIRGQLSGRWGDGWIVQRLVWCCE
mmetsp:Transcript_28030/g.70003  ORF Transcript_28030/g.70003 Transcript_28030/m.70003 type:complete len:205 (+) Transcript_28030:680-1294(+)